MRPMYGCESASREAAEDTDSNTNTNEKRFKIQLLRFAAQEVADRLEAWRDHAEYQLRSRIPAEEAGYRNTRDNYDALIKKLREAISASE